MLTLLEQLWRTDKLSYVTLQAPVVYQTYAAFEQQQKSHAKPQRRKEGRSMFTFFFAALRLCVRHLASP
jgi:hypothetical protein